MAKVTIYCTSYCKYCLLAKEFFDSKGIEYDDVRVELEHSCMEEMLQRTGGLRKVPQIFIGDEHIGSYYELMALDKDGQLEARLAAADQPD